MARYVRLVLALALLIIGIMACTAGKQNLDAELGQESETRIYEVFGMDCPGCHGGLKKILLKNPAILSAEANWVEKRVTIKVRSDSKLSDDEVYDAIKRANFTPGKRIK
jgi:copper chaperone CopZ